jgi:tetrahydromethanopterin S-methyltransferase subunit H
MPAAYQEIYLDQGTTFNEQITLDDNNGVPFNLTGFSVASEARKSYYSANADIVFVSTIVDANNGVIQLSANSAVTANVYSSKLVYDVIITQASSGNVTRVLEGVIYVSPSVTR